jgi:hypothetical protein
VTRALLIVLGLCFFSSVLPADYQAGLDAYINGDYDTAITEWQAVVESPPGAVPNPVRAETLYAIGMLFWIGQGVQQDTVEAASWLHVAAGMNHPGAQNKLGFLYSSGQGVRQSDFEAFKWWQLAANQGDADAQYNLGVMYRDGLGVEPDAEKSMLWFREAASNGDPVSAGILAQYEAGTEDDPLSITAPETAGESWIAGRDPEHFTIQVIALSNPEKLHQFIAQEPGLEPFAIYRQSNNNRPLWVLVQGDYPDLSTLRRALQSFPETIQLREKLWVRRFEMVQRLLE